MFVLRIQENRLWRERSGWARRCVQIFTVTFLFERRLVHILLLLASIEVQKSSLEKKLIFAISCCPTERLSQKLIGVACRCSKRGACSARQSPRAVRSVDDDEIGLFLIRVPLMGRVWD